MRNRVYNPPSRDFGRAGPTRRQQSARPAGGSGPFAVPGDVRIRIVVQRGKSAGDACSFGIGQLRVRWTTQRKRLQPVRWSDRCKNALGACGMLGFAMLLTLVSVVIHAFTGTVYMIVIGLVPFLFGLGITALISPNVVRAMGQFGGHLPKYYKFIGWGIAGFSILLMFPIMIVLYQAGFRSTSTPRPRPRFQQASPSPPAQAAPAPARQIAANNNAAGGQENLNAVKPPKSYPVSIAIPDHSVAVPQKAKLAPGTRLQACYFDKWNPITLLSENEDGTLNVRWDDWGEKFDCTMIRRELIIRKDVLNPSLKPPSSVASQPASAKDAGSVDSKPAQKPLKAYPVTIAVPPDHQFVPDGAKLQPGTRLQACYAGKWNPITFLSENQDGTLTVRWDDYGPVYDCSMIRKELIIAKNALR